MAHMTVPNIEFGYVDKRRASILGAEPHTHIRNKSVAVFTANAAGTTTTIVGANAAPGTNDNNVVRRADKFVLYNSSNVLKEETVFTVDTIAVAASTTVTFSPAAAGATASGDYARFIGGRDTFDEESLDDRLTTLGYTAATIRTMTQNDKIYAIRLADDPESI